MVLGHVFAATVLMRRGWLCMPEHHYRRHYAQASGMAKANWGAVDLVYPFPLIKANSTASAASMRLWSSPERTDKHVGRPARCKIKRARG